MTNRADAGVESSRAHVLGCEIDRLGMEETIQRCIDAIEAGETCQHVSINAAKLVALRSDPDLREFVSHCHLVSADGQAVVWASRVLGDPLPERIAGIDLMERLFLVAEQREYRVFILGTRPEVLEIAVRKLRRRHPRLLIAGYRSGFFADDESEMICTEIRAAHPQILFVAMGSPRKEYWIAEHAPHLNIPFLMGVGGAIDVVAGVTRRAPRVLQRLGLEWLVRLVQEPRRLWRRYLSTNFAFLRMVIAEFARQRPTARTGSAR